MRTKIWVPAIVAAIAASAPAGAAERPAGGIYGGVTPHGWPVIIQVARDGRTITRAAMALERTCTSGEYVFPDRYEKVSISRTGAFSSSFGPSTVDNDDGTHTDYTGSLKGKLDRRRGRITGTWRLQSVEKDAAGNVTDTCVSNAVPFVVKQ